MNNVVLLIRRTRPTTAPIDARTNIYTDLGFNSLAFMELLTRVEEEYGFEFAITEMEPCLVVGALVSVVKERARHDQERVVQQGYPG
ncbi:MAG: acyl carrier protein [Oscillospiraceae bacterium]|nr:acyl carrier protein [Oscillospiraceae bacterium]